jgi:toxin FitB
LTLWLADTSVAVPLIQASHIGHLTVAGVVGRRSVQLPAHAAVETYSVLTRLPGDARLTPRDATNLITNRFGEVVSLDPVEQRQLVLGLALAGIAGGAVYDAVIAITARTNGATLLTRDRRAANTYNALNTPFELIADDPV